MRSIKSIFGRAQELGTTFESAFFCGLRTKFHLRVQQRNYRGLYPSYGREKSLKLPYGSSEFPLQI